MNQTEASAVRIDESWLKRLKSEFDKPYFQELKMFLANEKKVNKVYPPGSQIFEAFNRTSFDAIKVVVLGQDPYHGFGQAHGLCFSVNKGIALPPSLKNIFKEQQTDLGIQQPLHGDLSTWADQGVFLLNATLSVVDGKPGSHQGKGWEVFTDAVIRTISAEKQNVVFMLWGRFAQAKSALIDADKHLVLQAAHPSPFSAHSGFFGCKHFSTCNAFLQQKGLSAIEWLRPA